MIDSIFILSGLGEVLIEKHYRHGTSRSSIADLFWERAASLRSREMDEDKFDNNDLMESEIPPVVLLGPKEEQDTSHSKNNNSNNINNRKKFAVHIKRGDLTFVAGISRETPPMMAIEFLHRIADVLTDYLGEPDEVKIKDAFSTVYQILDEMMDGGMCLVTEFNTLKSMIAPPTVANKVKAVVMGGAAASSVSSVLPVGAISTNPWRDKSVAYLQNEIFLDVEELLDCVLTPEDEVLSADVRGVIKMNTRLSGMPEVVLQFEDSSVLGDVSFHPCVRIDRWEREKVLSFVPPDGSFELMRYRAASKVVSPSAVAESVPFYCRPSVTLAPVVNPAESSSASSSTQQQQQDQTTTTTTMYQQGRMEILVGPKKRNFMSSYHNSNRPTMTLGSTSMTSTLANTLTSSSNSNNNLIVEDVCVKLPLPTSAKFLQAKASEGGGKCGFTDRTCVWNIGKLDLDKTAVRLTGTFAIPITNSSHLLQQQNSSTATTAMMTSLSTTCSLEFTWTAKPISGLRVSSLEITNQTYKYFKGVKSILKAGEFQIRC